MFFFFFFSGSSRQLKSPERISARFSRSGINRICLILERRLRFARVPPNLTFEIDDAEDEWLYSTQFDFIHTRTLCGGIRDWPKFHKQAYNNLRPGGWIEMHENEAWFQREDGTCPQWTKQFLEKLDEASIMSGNRLNVAGDQKQHMLDAGFANVRDEIFKVGCIFA